jgi:hypothetical protein
MEVAQFENANRKKIRIRASLQRRRLSRNPEWLQGLGFDFAAITAKSLSL